MKKIRIWMDCDPGHDDAVALLLAGRDPGLEILGVSTVAGNQTVEKTTTNALRVLQWAGIDVPPVYRGCGRPLVREPLVAAQIHGESGLDGPVFPPLERQAEQEHAVMALIRTLMASDGDVVLVPTGPLTNIGLALRLEPRIAKKIRRIVLMGGAYTNGNFTPAAEFNIFADAEAAHIVFTCGRPITMIGLDVTRQVLCTPEIVSRMAGIRNPASELFASLMGHFMKAQKEVFGLDGGPLHDPVTIASLIDPTVIRTKPMNVQIELDGKSYGRTNADYFGFLGLPPTADVAIGIDAAKFWDIVEAGLRRYGQPL